MSPRIKSQRVLSPPPTPAKRIRVRPAGGSAARLFAMMAFVCAAASGAHAGESAPAVACDSDVALVAPAFAPTIAFAEADTLAAPPKRKLMPDNLSIMERGLWGESGVLRGIGAIPALTPEERKSELGARRFMLGVHQIGGFTTMGLMIGALYTGQKTLDGGSRTMRSYHQMFVTSTIISYSLTGLLAIFAPPPMIRRDEFSTTTLHKTLAWAHVAGMIVTPILGSMINRRYGYEAAARVHQVSAYITSTIFATSLVVMTF